MAPKLTADATAAFDAAREAAEKRQHETLGVEHVLAAMAASDGAFMHLAKHGVNPVVLARVLDARLAALPARTPPHAYRDPQAVKTSPEVTEAIARAAPRGWWPWSAPRPVSTREMLDALLQSPTGIDVLEACEVDPRPVEELHAAAVDAARGMRHREPVVAHAFFAVLDHPRLAPEVANAARIAGGDRLALRNKLYGLIRRDFVSPRLDAVERLLAFAMFHASMLAVPHPSLSPTPLFVRWIRLDLVQAMLSAIDLAPYPFLFAIAHGATPVDGDADTSSETLAVVFHDDAFTTMEFVVRVLGECFDLDVEQAKNAMLEVHTNGSAVVGVYPAEEARARAAKVREAARGAWMPLRVTTRAPA
jgi:ATP-dependent Clp protease adaptor protein ClpS